MLLVENSTGAPHWITYVPYLFLGTSIGNTTYGWIFDKKNSDVYENRLFVFLVILLIANIALSSVCWYIMEGAIELYFFIIALFLFSIGFLLGYISETTRTLEHK